ncbi:Rv0909 family putative TA system antitoxin [Terrabacter sp. NPDC080008]|uniref:Rv0909 family putative TA system antitoxin n=1 Tax=Terrabacter sp. NPDC080008 TaxID=3155176 RepID=UPI00344CAD4C
MSFLDRLKKKAEELDLETKARQLQEAAAQAAQQAREKAGEFTAEHREQIDGYVETAGAKIDETTDHRFSGQIAKVTEQLERGVDLVADGYGTATGGAAAAGMATGPAAEPFPPDPDAPAPVRASTLEPPEPIDAPTPIDEQHPEQHHEQQAEPLAEHVDESLVDTALEDTVLGLDHPPVAAPHQDEPAPEDADRATDRSPRPPHESTS